MASKKRKPAAKSAARSVVQPIRTAREMPLGVKVLAVLGYIGAAIALIFAILFFVGASFVDTLLQGANVPIPAGAGAAVAVVMGVLCLILAVLSYFIGRGLWRGQQWARVLVIIFSVLFFLGGVLSLIQGIWSGLFNIIVYGIIGGYLWFNQDVKDAFS